MRPNMYGMKDEGLLLLVVFAAALIADTGGLYISQGSVTKSANETFFVMCRDEAGRPVRWSGSKGPLGPKTRPEVQITSYGTAIVFNTTVVEDTGTYTCTAGSNEAKNFTLTIESPLTFMDTDLEQTGEEGKDVLLRCEVQGGKVTWSIDEGAEITDNIKFKVLADGLLVKNVQRPDSKEYVCKAVQQSTGTVEDRRIRLKVLHKPTFPHAVYAKQEVMWSYVNSTVNLTCIVTANPPAKFEWYKSSDRKKKIGQVISESDDVSILQLHVVKSSFGNYKCVAHNKYGSLEKFFDLQEGDRPNTPKYIELRGANSNLLDLGIQGPDVDESDVGSQPTIETKGFQVQYKPKGENQWQSRDFNISQGDSYPLDELQHDTEYEVKAATRNIVGLSEFTEVSIFKTLKSQADGVHLNLPSLAIILGANIIYALIRRQMW